MLHCLRYGAGKTWEFLKIFMTKFREKHLKSFIMLKCCHVQNNWCVFLHTKKKTKSTVRRHLVGPGRHRSANRAIEGYPPRDGPSSQHHFPLLRTHHGGFNNTVIFMLDFSIILWIIALTSRILLHTNEWKFCPHGDVMSTIKINNGNIGFKTLKIFYCEAQLFQPSE